MDAIQVLAHPPDLVKVFHSFFFKLSLGTAPRYFDQRSSLLVAYNGKVEPVKQYPNLSLGKLTMMGSPNNPLCVEGTVFAYLVGRSKHELRDAVGQRKFREAVDDTIEMMRQQRWEKSKTNY